MTAAALGHVDAGAAREVARDILSERRFQGTDLPRPLRGLLEQLGRWLQPVADGIDRAIAFLVDLLPGGEATVWTIAAVLVLAAAATVAALLARRHATVTAEQRRSARLRSRDPTQLERDADEAERAGDYEAAVRLRFRAGLLRLDAANVISFRDSITSYEVARALGSADFDKVAASFDEIAYGGRPAAPDDAVTARQRWARLLERTRAA